MPHIYLYGPPGTGKSTVGKKLAANLNLPFIDLDRVIEMKAGIPISQIMEQQGEPAFRDLESHALWDLIHENESVVALGGGTLLRDENRAFAEGNGRIVLLMATLPTLLQRMQNDAGRRPLLSGDLNAKLSALLAKRGEHYSSFPLTVQMDGRLSEQNAYQIQLALGRHHLSAMGEYDAVVGNVEQLVALTDLQNPLIVTDENVAQIHAEKVTDILKQAGFSPKVFTVSAGEAYKNLETVSRMWRSFLENGLDRRSTIVALGGGVIGDMAGFAASTYMRGIPWIGLPTTLLSMVDASLGGKTGIDLPEGKNLIGSFYPPKLVLADPEFLLTLPERELISGMAEVVKHGIISDPELFNLCSNGLDWVRENLEEIVKRAMAVKIKVIEDDPYEKGFRAALNMGHTVGHAVELVSKFDLRHGEAIAIGMTAEAKYSAQIGLAGQGVVEAIESTLKTLNLPTQIPDEMPRAGIIKAMRVDKKKNAKAIRFALPVEIGRVELVDVTDLELVLE